MKSPRAHAPLLIRAVLAVAVVALLAAALNSRPTAEPASAPSTVAVATAPSPTLPLTLVPEPRPTATAEPYVEHIISRISRQTPPPYPTSTPLPANLAVVNVVDFGYLPGVTRIHPGQTVVWTNGGRELHDVTGDDWHSGPIEPATNYRQTFGYAGTFDYRCTVHLDMRGTIIVAP